jgi:hypothetical protein
MTDYGVGDPAWSPLPWSWAAERLSRSRNLWLVTVSGTGRPHALPVWGVWDDDDHRFAFSCATGARKARNLEADPRVVVAPEDTVECVSVEGRARALEPGERAEMWIARYLAKYRPMAPELDADFLRSNLLYEMVPERAFGIIEREAEFATRATRWSFDDGR